MVVDVVVVGEQTVVVVVLAEVEQLVVQLVALVVVETLVASPQLVEEVVALEVVLVAFEAACYLLPFCQIISGSNGLTLLFFLSLDQKLVEKIVLHVSYACTGVPAQINKIPK